MAEHAGRDFKSEWDFNPLRYRFRIAAADGLGALAMGAAIVAAPALAGIPLWMVGLAAAFSATLQYATVTSNRNIGHIVQANTIDAGDRYRNLARDIFLKAGLDPKSVICRTKDTPGALQDGEDGPALHSFYSNAVVFPKTLTMQSKDILLIGGEVLAALDDSELKAIIAHETSHIINRPGPYGRFIAGGMAYGCALLAVMSLATLNAPATLLCCAAFGLQHVFANIRNRQDEWRADYNSIGLHPQPGALSSALEKLGTMQNRQAGQKLCAPTRLRDVASHYFRMHPSIQNRKANSQKLFASTAAFYTAKGITPGV